MVNRDWAASCAVVMDIGWSGKSRDGLDVLHLTRDLQRGQAALAAGTTRHSNTLTLTPPGNSSSGGRTRVRQVRLVAGSANLRLGRSLNGRACATLLDPLSNLPRRA